MMKGTDKAERIRETAMATKSLSTYYVLFVLGWCRHIYIHTHPNTHAEHANRIRNTVLPAESG